MKFKINFKKLIKILIYFDTTNMNRENRKLFFIIMNKIDK